MIGTTLQHYRIVGKLGEGGMGEVYAAEDTKLQRRVALKLLPPDMAADPERLQRFQREARAIAALNHPNVVTIYSVEETDGVQFLTMELVEGKTLGELIPEDGLPLEELLRLALPLVDAVAAAHEHGIIHRDLKPANVMLASDGRLKVLDFGLAKLKPEASTASVDDHAPGRRDSLTSAHAIVGTAAYMSPEQAEGRPVDHRSDIFSLGVVLYEMASGRRPFGGDTVFSLISSIIKDTPRPTLGREAGRSAGARPHRDEGAGQGPRRAVPECARVARTTCRRSSSRRRRAGSCRACSGRVVRSRWTRRLALARGWSPSWRAARGTCWPGGTAQASARQPVALRFRTDRLSRTRASSSSPA